MNPSYQSKIPGKLIVWGEYSILFPGFWGLGLACNLSQACIQFTPVYAHSDDPRAEPTLGQLNYFTVTTDLEEQKPAVQRMLELAYSLLPAGVALPGHWQIDTLALRQPTWLQTELKEADQHSQARAEEGNVRALRTFAKNYKLGLGSSSAMASGIVLCMQQAGMIGKGNLRAACFAYLLHFIWSGNKGSGLDIAVQVYGQQVLMCSIDSAQLSAWVQQRKWNSALSYLEDNWLIRPFTWQFEASRNPVEGPYQALIALSQSCKTSQQINKIKQFYDSPVLKQWLQETRQLNEALLQLFYAGPALNWSSWCHLLNDWGQHINKLDHQLNLGIHTSESRLLQQSVEQQFTEVRAKTTGAGGGDLMYVYGPNKTQWDINKLTNLSIPIHFF